MKLAQPKHRKILLESAKRALKKAYAPYSGYRVGAALLGRGGKVFTGCNVENQSFGATVCAERVALFKAVSEGERKITALALVAGDGRRVVPCGICRQALSEFSRDLEIVIGFGPHSEVMRFRDLYPDPFIKPRD